MGQRAVWYGSAVGWRLAICAGVSALMACAVRASCPPAGQTPQTLAAWRQAHFAFADPAQPDRLASSLADCLSSPDPTLRDATAFEALATWLRAGQLRATTERALEQRLRAELRVADPQGFRRPFAALTLSELARADRLNPYLSDSERAALVQSAVAYLSSVRDYRGFEEGAGWRHGVAHGSDLIMQLARNPDVGVAQQEAMLDALASQVAPPAHFYIFGEPGRLARATVAIAARGLISPTKWDQWLGELARPPDAGWPAASASTQGLARVHDLSAFLQSVFVQIELNPDPQLVILRDRVQATLRTLP